ncbi:hypothetical protein LSPH24S_02709 [Lysinibacillus sphaericus]
MWLAPQLKKVNEICITSYRDMGLELSFCPSNQFQARNVFNNGITLKLPFERDN